MEKLYNELVSNGLSMSFDNFLISIKANEKALLELIGTRPTDRK